MIENRRQLQALIQEINKRREVYNQEGVAAIQELYVSRNRKHRKPQRFNESSFLFIRSYEGDTGNRPLPGNLNFWNTPDISFAPVTGTTPVTTNELRAGETYQVRCRLYNRGDMTVPYPKVEFFLTDPSLGFDTRFSTFLGVTQMNGLLLPNGIGEAQFTYRVPPQEAGHKCFFARTYSFSPLDKPYSVYALDPVTDRHIGQKNLHITGQAAAYTLHLIHLPTAEETIQFMPLRIQDIIALGDRMLGNYQFRESRSASVFYKQEIKILTGDQHTQIKRGRTEFQFLSRGEGPDLRQQVKIHKAFTSALRRIESGKAKPSEFKEVFAAKRRMDSFHQKTTLSINLPRLALARGEAIGLNIVNRNTITGAVKGGITLIITG